MAKSVEPEIRNNLAELRKRSGRAASALAAEVGVSRQAIHAIEAGTYVPNTGLSLRLAKVLGVRVDELFQLKDKVESVKSQRAELLPGSPAPARGQAVQVGRVDSRLIALPPAPLEWYLPLSDATVLSDGSRGKITLQAHQENAEFENRLLIAGCDPASSILARHLQSSGVEAVLIHRNSSEALTLLKQGHVHLAGTHLRDNAAIKGRFAHGSVAVISFASWQEGIIVAPGNPKRICGIDDLARKSIRFVNREPGAGTRLLLDNALNGLGVKPKAIRGYDQEAPGHLAAALKIKSGAADCCIATEAAARALGLAFVPLQTARYDFVIHRSHLQLPTIRILCDTIARLKFRRELSSAAGYDTTVTGSRVL